MKFYKSNQIDKIISQRINQAIYRQSVVNARLVEVFVKDQVVTLKGYVFDIDSKNYISELIHYIPGIKLVRNDILIKSEEELRPQKSSKGLIDNITGLN